jgi:hypothetical protein
MHIKYVGRGGLKPRLNLGSRVHVHVYLARTAQTCVSIPNNKEAKVSAKKFRQPAAREKSPRQALPVMCRDRAGP